MFKDSYFQLLQGLSKYSTFHFEFYAYTLHFFQPKLSPQLELLITGALFSDILGKIILKICTENINLKMSILQFKHCYTVFCGP